ncbi:hypothetical protein HDV06_000892 [Boothiomyces sp. JEL0866]|nr:hypothetical protein HDV06_000892 [Boothiomyces sp. JEL0866]
MDDMCGGFKLTRIQRFQAFGVCFGAGFLISFFATFSLWTAQFGLFAVLYSIGNIISLMATGFLIGFTKQFKKMFDETRRTATIVFLSSLVITLICAFVLQIAILTLIAALVQFLALLWYSLSYIPFARDGVKGMFKSCF